MYATGVYDKPCLRELTTKLAEQFFLTPNCAEAVVMNRTEPRPYSTVPRPMEPRFVYSFTVK